MSGRYLTYSTPEPHTANPVIGFPTAAAASSSSKGAELPTQPELVDQFLAAVKSSRRSLLHLRKLDITQEFQRAPGDDGSSEVQIALLTDKIRDMAEHFQKHKKDYHSMRGLQGMLNQRRKLLGYLRRSNFERYAFVIHKLGLKDTYAKQMRYDKYRVGTRLGTPAEPLWRYGTRPTPKRNPKRK